MPDQHTTDTEESSGMNDDRSPEWGTSSFDAGPDVGLVSRHTVGLIERDNPSTRERLWSLVADDAALDDVLDELSSTGLKALPDFGLAQTEGSTVRVVARGRTTITIEHSSGETSEIDASGVRTWIEEVVEDVAALTIELPLLDDDDVVLSSERFAVLAGSVPARLITRRYDAADVHAEQAIAGWSAQSPTATAALMEHETVEPETSIAHDSSPGSRVIQPADTPTPAPDDLQQRDAAGAPISPPPPDVPPASPQPAGPPVVAAVEAVDPSTDGWDVPDENVDDDIAPPADDDSDGEPEARSAVLVFSNGERVLIDRRVLIGRNPKVGDDIEGEMPHLMKFDGPGQGLSRTHAQISLDGGDLLLEDLESTNGTEVQLPGQQRRRVRPGEPMVVVAGTLIDFGEELHCTIELAD